LFSVDFTIHGAFTFENYIAATISRL